MGERPSGGDVGVPGEPGEQGELFTVAHPEQAGSKAESSGVNGGSLPGILEPPYLSRFADARKAEVAREQAGITTEGAVTEEDVPPEPAEMPAEMRQNFPAGESDEAKKAEARRQVEEARHRHRII